MINVHKITSPQLCHRKNKGARVMAKAMYDPWSKIVTKNGYAGDEVK